MELNHVRRGIGEPLVLIHGIGGDWRSWEPLVDRLAAERDVLALDMPGFGDSRPLPAGREPTAPALAGTIADFLRATVGSDPVHVAGHSLGGWAALELAKLGVARRVTAVAPAGFWTRGEASYVEAVLRLTAWLPKRAYPLVSWGLDRPLVRGALLAGQFGHPGRVPAEAAVHMMDVLRRSTGYDRTRRAMTGDRFRGGDAVDVPVSILWGTHDGLLFPRQAARAKRAVRGAKLEMLRGAGHFAHWDEPDAVVDELLR